MEHEEERRAAESVEWLAALWELAEEGESRCANPHLLTLLRFSPGLGAHPALGCVARLRRTHSRDQLIKAVVGAAYGEEGGHGELCDSLRALAAEAGEILGPGPFTVLQQARDKVRQRAEDLAGNLDPAADLFAVTGERLPLRVVLAPSVCLPPPQAGRHGVLVRRPEGRVVHLHFGFPLRQDPQQFGINRTWLLGGAWHYAINFYLEPFWPEIVQRLAGRHDLAEAVCAAMGSARDREPGAWTEILRTHVNVALKALLSRRLGLPDAIHRVIARASGLVLFPWFESWLLGNGAEGAALAAHIATLPEALEEQRPRWASLASPAANTPPAVNLALVSPSARRACLVVPDEWSQEAAAAAVAGWRLLPLPLLRYGEWVHTRKDDAGPVIAFGEPERNPLVRRVLEQRGLSLETLGAADPAIIALSLPGFEDAAWCIAVAVRQPGAAAPLHMEMVLEQTSSYVLFDGGVMVGAGRIPLDQLYTS